MIDLKSRVIDKVSVEIAARTASVNGTGVDLAPYDGATGLFIAGAWTDGTHTPKLQDSPDNTTWTDVAAANLIGSYTAISATSASARQHVAYIGAQRYLRGVITVAGATTGMLEGFDIQCGTGRKLPIT